MSAALPRHSVEVALRARRRRARKVCTIQEAAAMDWEPWDSDPSAETALSKDEWQAIGITCRIAYSINLKTRAELVAMPVDLGPDAFMDFHGEIAASLAQVEYLRTVLSVAEARLLAAGSTFACQATGRDR